MGFLVNEPTFEAALAAHLESGKTVPVKAVFTPGRVARFLSVTPSMVSNWASRYDTFPEPLNGNNPTLYDIREVVRWWISWEPENKIKYGALPGNWLDLL